MKGFRAMIKKLIVKTLIVLYVVTCCNCAQSAQANKQCAAEGKSILTCHATMEDDILILENDYISRTYFWNNGNLISKFLTDKTTGQRWELSNDAPDFFIPDITLEGTGGKLNVYKCDATSYTPEHLKAEVIFNLGKLEVKRVFRIYPNCPAIACDYYLRGTKGKTWFEVVGQKPKEPEKKPEIKEGEIVSYEFATDLIPVKAPVIERIWLPDKHWRFVPVEFFDTTDYINTVVQESPILGYRFDNNLVGNILFATNQLNKNGIFILKEAPCSQVQLAYPGCDFICKYGNIRTVGIGIKPSELSKTDWIRGYGFVTGVTSGGELGRLKALRSYQENIRIRQVGRDEMVMMNTWGDRSMDTVLNEEFAIAELKAGKKLGITHLQLDDGWQTGRSGDSPLGTGSLENIWDDPNYWRPRKTFPNGLAPVVEYGKKVGIEICLWFNPSADDGYAHWKSDAQIMIDLYNEFGIRMYKIDGVDIANKTAEMNLSRMFEMVMKATNNNAVFNLDVTGVGERFGYHYFNQYGTIFVENRYTDWKNYYPHWTLRNLWMLSRYVPPQLLQTEFLNKWRNKSNYAENDIFAPWRIPFDYCFAVTMMAQPLAWFEATGLPKEAFEIAPLIKKYVKNMEDIHAGQIFPIGEEPSGRGWTGFQSMKDDGSGYFLVFREYNKDSKSLVQTWLAAGEKVKCKAVLGHGKNFKATVDKNGKIQFALPKPYSFALYKYTLTP